MWSCNAQRAGLGRLCSLMSKIFLATWVVFISRAIHQHNRQIFKICIICIICEISIICFENLFHWKWNRTVRCLRTSASSSFSVTIFTAAGPRLRGGRLRPAHTKVCPKGLKAAAQISGIKCMLKMCLDSPFVERYRIRTKYRRHFFSLDLRRPVWFFWRHTPPELRVPRSLHPVCAVSTRGVKSSRQIYRTFCYLLHLGKIFLSKASVSKKFFLNSFLVINMTSWLRRKRRGVQSLWLGRRGFNSCQDRRTKCAFVAQPRAV